MSCTTKQSKAIMRTLTNREFKNYLNSLEVINECGYAYAQDEVGNVCEINTLEQDVIELSDVAIIDGYEYNLNEKQQDRIILYAEGLIENGAEAFTDEDRQDQLNLIYA